jgi:hypothetical protein
MNTRQANTRRALAGAATTLALTMAPGCSDEPALPAAVTQCMEDEACVVLKSIRSRITEEGIELEPTEFDEPSRYTAVSLQADGTAIVRTGESPTPGYLIIRDVPPGPYYLQVDGYYELQEQRFVDWSAYSVTRTDTEVVERKTMLELDLRGLEPWELDDTLRLWVPSLDRDYPLPVSPEQGSESLVVSLDYAELRDLRGSAPLRIDGDRGDRVLIRQFSQGLKRVLRVPPFVQTEGETFRITGELEPVEGVQKTVDCGFSELASTLAGTVPGGTIETNAYPHLYAAPPELAGRYSGATLAIPAPMGDMAAFEYVNLMSPAWIEWVECSVTVRGTQLLPYSAATVRQLLDRAVAAPAAPVVGPVGTIRLDGQDASLPLAGVSLTPVISWDSPSLGEATAYQVSVYEELSTAPNPVARFWLQGLEGEPPPTQMLLPPDILRTGSSYALLITAVSRPNDAASPPTSALAQPEGTALRVTAEWTPGLANEASGHSLADP